MGPDGVLVTSRGATHWAWVGVRLLPALEEWADVDDQRTRADVVATERAWLAGQWATSQGTRWEVRYSAPGGGRPLSCVLLGRVHDTSAAAVTAGARRLLERLATPPRHVKAEPFTDTAELHAALTVPQPDPRGAVELRKPLRWSPDPRREPGLDGLVAISPLAGNDLSWQPAWSELAALPASTTVGVHLEPYATSPALLERFRQRSRQYAAIGAARTNNPTWQVALPGDPFATAAAATYEDAVRRYADRPYRLRVAISSTGPVPGGFAELLATTVGGASVCRTAAADAATAWRNTLAMNRDWLAETYGQGAPASAIGDAERILSDLVDADEAATAFRFPYEMPGRSPLFEGSVRHGVPWTAPGPAGRRVFVSYVREDLALVRRLVDDLTRAGHDVWFARDGHSLRPGMRWKNAIRKAIQSGTAFVPCCSRNSYAKPKSFMNEELRLAAEEFRMMPQHRTWLIPVRLDDCRLPEVEIGAGQGLESLHIADFSGSWQHGLTALLAALDETNR